MNYLLINLAIADIVYATFVAPKVLLLRLSFIHHPDGVTGTVLCTLLTAGNITWIGAASSVVTLTAIAIERYYAVLYPLGNKGKLTNRKLKVSSVENFLLLLSSVLFKAVNLIIIIRQTFKHTGYKAERK